ncbi:MAG TPA: hypothetical protein VGL55_17440 [Steroidobacteraceae bacterium]|jgi:hypothetical protein
MKVIVLTALVIGFVGSVACWTPQARVEAVAVSQRIAYAAMSLPRFPSGCSPIARLATNDLCAFQN